jgi:mannose-6-phosphate isomerase-like protein (cupin superfamily)
MMNDFPAFMKSPKNKISSRSQYGTGIHGYVYDGADGSQMACWTHERDGISQEHVHDYDEYFLVVQGKYTLIIGDKKIPVGVGQEYFIPKGLAHAGEYSAGTRTIHALVEKESREKLRNRRHMKDYFHKQLGRLSWAANL